MCENIRLCTHIDETVVCPFQILAIIGILTYNADLICLYL
jgi:hypothetical protein